MKDQNQGHTNQSHDKNHDNHYQKSEHSGQKNNHPGFPDQKNQSSERNHSTGEKQIQDNEKNSSNERDGFHEVDHKKMKDFSKRLENDEGLRNKYQQDPHAVLEEEGINLPRGMRASYDDQYLKDEKNQYRYGKRFGHINLSHQ